MTLGEICNFVAYAFTEAILVTPLGATAVVVSAVLSSIFLKERLSFVGKVGCALCVVGTVQVVLNAPEQTSASTIQQVKSYIISPGFLAYAGAIIVLCIGIAVYVGPRWGNKVSCRAWRPTSLLTNAPCQSMFVYISICSLIGGISVVCTQGFGASVVSAIGGTPNQWNNWFLWVLFVFVAATLITEIIYLNKALNIFNTSAVTPVYFTCFTSATIVASAVLFRGFRGSATQIVTMVFGFLTIVGGIVLLQFSLTAAHVPDHAVLSSGLDDVKEMTELEHEEQDTLDPGPAALRGASLIRTLTRKVSSAEREELRRRASARSAVSRSASTGAGPSARRSASSSSWALRSPVSRQFSFHASSPGATPARNPSVSSQVSTFSSIPAYYMESNPPYHATFEDTARLSSISEAPSSVYATADPWYYNEEEPYEGADMDDTGNRDNEWEKMEPEKGMHERTRVLAATGPRSAGRAPRWMGPRASSDRGGPRSIYGQQHDAGPTAPLHIWSPKQKFSFSLSRHRGDTELETGDGSAEERVGLVHAGSDMPISHRPRPLDTAPRWRSEHEHDAASIEDMYSRE